MSNCKISLSKRAELTRPSIKYVDGKPDLDDANTYEQIQREYCMCYLEYAACDSCAIYEICGYIEMERHSPGVTLDCSYVCFSYHHIIKPILQEYLDYFALPERDAIPAKTVKVEDCTVEILGLSYDERLVFCRVKSKDCQQGRLYMLPKDYGYRYGSLGLGVIIHSLDLFISVEDVRLKIFYKEK